MATTSEATVNLLIELVKMGVEVYKDKKGDQDPDLDDMKVSEAVAKLRAMRVRSVEELVEEGKRLAEKDQADGSNGDGA